MRTNTWRLCVCGAVIVVCVPFLCLSLLIGAGPNRLIQWVTRWYAGAAKSGGPE